MSGTRTLADPGISKPQPQQIFEVHPNGAAETLTAIHRQTSGGTTYTNIKAAIYVGAPPISPDHTTATALTLNAGEFSEDLTIPDRDQAVSTLVEMMMAPSFVYFFRSTDNGTSYPDNLITIQQIYLYQEPS